jgi:hypothetical protein
MEDVPKVHYIQVPVPEDLVEDVYAFLTERRRRGAVVAEPVDDPAAPDLDESKDEPQWDGPALRDFLGRANSQLCDLLVFLAKHAPEPIGADEALVAVGLTPGRSAGGFLSRAARSSRHHFGRNLPLQKDWNAERGRYDYYVTSENARVILDYEADPGS